MPRTTPPYQRLGVGPEHRVRVDEDLPFLLPRSMPAFRVFLQCTSSTLRPGGVFDTLVMVSDDELAADTHVRAACRRAAILGYGGPQQVVEVRRFDFLAPGLVEAVEDRERSESPKIAMEVRLLSVLDSAAQDSSNTGQDDRDTAESGVPQHDQGSDSASLPPVFWTSRGVGYGGHVARPEIPPAPPAPARR